MVRRLEVGHVARIDVDEELNGLARRGDNCRCGDLVHGGVGHGDLFWVEHGALIEGGAAGGAPRRGHFEVGRCGAEDLVRFVKGLKSRVRGVFGCPFG